MHETAGGQVFQRAEVFCGRFAPADGSAVAAKCSTLERGGRRA